MQSLTPLFVPFKLIVLIGTLRNLGLAKSTAFIVSSIRSLFAYLMVRLCGLVAVFMEAFMILPSFDKVVFSRD